MTEPTIPAAMMPLPEPLRRLVLTAIERAGEDGLTAGELRRRSQGSKAFGELLVLAVDKLAAEGILERETVKQAGRGRPKVLLKFRGERDDDSKDELLPELHPAG